MRSLHALCIAGLLASFAVCDCGGGGLHTSSVHEDASIPDDPKLDSGDSTGLDAGESDSGPVTMANDPDGGGADAATNAPPEVHSFQGSTETIPNPERGFYRVRDLPAGTDPTGVSQPMDFSDFVTRGDSLVLGYVRLDDYRTTALPDAFIAEVEARLDAMRAAGLKTVLRFAYNRGPYPVSEPDASKAQILSHIAQLTPLLEQYEDVIAVLQAGFIGAWGEWDASTNNLADPQDKLDIETALLAALPASRSTQIRVPSDKAAMFGGPATLFDGSPLARTGHHNDCFLASDDDYGTYPPMMRETWLTYLAVDTLIVPIGGETCILNPPRSDCTSALSEMSRIHYSYLNGEFSADVIAAWQQQGCLGEIAQHLGYRFIADQIEMPPQVVTGSPFTIRLNLHNEGFAAPFNERPAFLVLDGPQRLEFPIESDPRTWGSAVALSVDAAVPAGGEGTYMVALWLPDAMASLRNASAYAIRVPNAAWDASSGLNGLGTVVVAKP